MITQGKWEAIETPFGFCISAGPACTAIAERYFDREPTATELNELHDNARLMAEAGTVYNVTGFTPRRLTEDRTGLLKTCKMALRAMNAQHTPSIISSAIIKIEQAIAKSEGA
ncbi:hypothetical protein LCGC14_1284570 [marine sediment metagenome]|uniref:Uncharacterized protein n=1 Tax=marine sediment metagenome TaxID=412755 RepID=A0A0F9NAX1_9ZZZZ